MDLYLPGPTSKPRPLIVLIHGGGWMAGDKESFGGLCLTFARRGYAAATLNYRLSQEAIWPAQLIDCKAAIRWLRANAETYHIDPKRIVVGGHSAGGHLAAMLGVTNHKKEFEQGDNLKVSSEVQAVLWFSGVSDFAARAEAPGYEAEQSPGSGESKLIGGPVLENREKALQASPIHYVDKHAAPMDLFHGDKDELVPVSQAISMYNALQKAQVLSELHLLAGEGHGAKSYFSPEMLTSIDFFLSRALHIDLSQPRLKTPGKGPYVIASVSAPALALDAGAGENVQARIMTPAQTASQQWTFTPRGDGYFSIHPLSNPSLALTVEKGEDKDGTKAVLTVDKGHDSQRWKVIAGGVTGSYVFQPKCAPKRALDDLEGKKEPATPIDIWIYVAGDSHEEWTLEPAK